MRGLQVHALNTCTWLAGYLASRGEALRHAARSGGGRRQTVKYDPNIITPNQHLANFNYIKILQIAHTVSLAVFYTESALIQRRSFKVNPLEQLGKDESVNSIFRRWILRTSLLVVLALSLLQGAAKLAVEIPHTLGGRRRSMVMTHRIDRRLSQELSRRLVITAALIFGMVASLAGVRPAAAAMQYTITDLGTLGGTSADASGLNNKGQVVGAAATADGQHHAYVWQGGLMQDLGTFGGQSSSAMDINDDGYVVGQASIPNGINHAFLWHNGTMTDLGVLGGPTWGPEYGFSWAKAINNKGQIVGSSSTNSVDGASHAFLYQDGMMQDLGTLGGNVSSADDINESGQVVGYAMVAGGANHAFLWENGTMRDLGTLGGSESYAFGINDRGQVTGYSETASGGWNAFLWENGTMQNLEAPSGHHSSWAYDINIDGQIVGDAYDDYESVAALWENGTTSKLNDLLPDDSQWMALANAINDKGQVVGNGYRNGEQRALLLMPQSEVHSQTVGAGEAALLTTDTEGNGATASDPLETHITSSTGLPDGGTLTVEETATDVAAPGGFSFLNQQVNISAPALTSGYYEVTFTLDSSVLASQDPPATADSIAIFKTNNGTTVGVADCADPVVYPCVSGRATLDGDAWITVRTQNFSSWNFGISTLSYELKGFYSPVDMSGTLNAVKAGATVPMKFEVFEGKTEITDASIVSISSRPVPCPDGSLTDAIELTTSGSTSLRYDETAGQFIYNWKTPKTAGCHAVTLTTTDGTSMEALFRLK